MGVGELDVQIAVDGKTRSVTDLIAGAVDGVIMTPVRASLTSVVGFSIIWEPLAVDEIAVQVVTSGAGDEAMVLGGCSGLSAGVSNRFGG